MWPIVCKHLLGFGSAFFVGWAIRLMDDALDSDLDQLVGKINWSTRLGGGTTAYALYAFAFAVLLNPAVGVTLLAGAYAVGMIGESRRLPTRLPGYLEGALLWLASAWRFGLATAWAALGIMIAVQLIDDLLDHAQDQWLKSPNWTTKMGLIGTLLVCVTLLAILHFLDAWLLSYATLAFIYFQLRERVGKHE